MDSENFDAKVASVIEFANRRDSRSASNLRGEASNDGRSEAVAAGGGEEQQARREREGAEKTVRVVSVQDGKQINVRNQALVIYETIGNEYARIYERESKSKAHRYFLLELRKNQRILVDGGIYTAKELDERVKELQSHLKEGGDEGKMTMADQFSAWLNEEPHESQVS